MGPSWVLILEHYIFRLVNVSIDMLIFTHKIAFFSLIYAGMSRNTTFNYWYKDFLVLFSYGSLGVVSKLFLLLLRNSESLILFLFFP